MEKEETLIQTSKPNPSLVVEEKLFFEIKRLLIVLRHHVFSEDEAAEYCRCSAESIKYHALRSRKLTFLKFSKEGLVFLKPDLDKFLENARVEGFRDHS